MSGDVKVDCPVDGCTGFVIVLVTYDPGVWSFSNGDPGYPPTWETNVPEKCESCGTVFTEEQLDKLDELACDAYAAQPEPEPPGGEGVQD